jgi:uncharacterized protein YyaL (SSP411 family)
VIAAMPGDESGDAMVHAVRRRYLPNAATIVRPGGGDAEPVTQLIPFVRDQGPVDGRATAFVCRNYVCLLPVHTPEELMRMLDHAAPEPDSR